jgi:hypothetical protein
MHRGPLALLLLLLLLLATPMVSAAEYYNKDKQNKKRGEATEDMALVYVFRPATLGAAIKTWAFADDQFLGVSKSKGYYFAHVPPGKHIFWSKAENTSALELNVEAGHTYYFKQAIKMGFNKARVKMIQIDETQVDKLFDKCGYTEPTDAGRQRAVEIAANRMDRAENKATKREKKQAAREGDD